MNWQKFWQSLGLSQAYVCFWVRSWSKWDTKYSTEKILYSRVYQHSGEVQIISECFSWSRGSHARFKAQNCAVPICTGSNWWPSISLLFLSPNMWVVDILTLSHRFFCPFLYFESRLLLVRQHSTGHYPVFHPYNPAFGPFSSAVST